MRSSPDDHCCGRGAQKAVSGDQGEIAYATFTEQARREEARRQPIPDSQAGAALLGLTVAEVRDAVPDVDPAIVDRVLTDRGWLHHTKETASSATGKQPMPADFLRAVADRVRTHADAAQRAQAREARYRADHVCRVLGRFDESTRPRPLPWSPPGDTVRVSDRGLAALTAAWAEQLTTGEMDAARRYVAEHAPPAPQAVQETPKRRRR